MEPALHPDLLADAVDQVRHSVVAIGHAHGAASGTVLKDNLVVTVAHVMGRGREGAVLLADGKEAKATLLGVHPPSDLAVLRVDAELKAPVWEEQGPLRVGQLVLMVGRPRTQLRATLGMLSAVEGPWRTPRGANLDRFLDVDGELPPGFSGGPLVSAQGKVLGINSHGVLRGGVTLPAASVRALAERLLEHGEIAAGYLGVGVQGVKLPADVATAAGQPRAVLVGSVEDGSPAQAAGVEVGDLLLRLDDQTLGGVEDLMAALSTRGQQPVTLRLWHRGAVKNVALTLGRRAPAGSSGGCCG